MPFNEIEVHPFLQKGECISSNKMIIGTFPIYSITQPRTQRKNQLQHERGDISLFYGSKSNYFWNWYKQYVDPNLIVQNPESILNSLNNHKIGISDVIKECSRIEESFEDNKLKNKVWNTELAKIIDQRIEKIICTSKSDSGAMGWLRDKILIPAGFSINESASKQLHLEILNTIPQSNTQIKPIAQVLQKGEKRVSIVALPSPGSPQRRLLDFGFLPSYNSTTNYLNAYLTITFDWFQHERFI